MTTTAAPIAKAATVGSPAMLGPLVLAQFLCSYAASSLNVAISAIAGDLGTNVAGVQTAITVFTLTMAALMIPGSKLTDILGRKRCFMLGLTVYGVGAVVASASQGLGGLTIGYSILQGLGTALLIPPVYILATIFYTDVASRARAFGAISAAAGVGAALGPLLGGLITTTTSWRVSFLFQAVLVVTIVVLARRIQDPAPDRATAPRFDVTGALYSAAGLAFIVVGILLAGTYGWFAALQDFAIGDTVLISEGGISPVWLFEAIAALLLWAFLRHIRSVEQAGGEPLLHTRMLRNRVANLGLVTQHLQWFILLGLSFVMSVYLQQVRGHNAVETGLILTPATIGILAASALAERMAKRRAQAAVIRGGFALTAVGIVLLVLFVDSTSGLITFVPGLLAVGLGVGAMLTASVNVVQSSFGEADQGEISGLSRSVSNLGSSIGVALTGSVVVSPFFSGNQGYVVALIVLTVVALIGLATSVLGPRGLRESAVQAGGTAAPAASAASGKGGLRRAG